MDIKKILEWLEPNIKPFIKATPLFFWVLIVSYISWLGKTETAIIFLVSSFVAIFLYNPDKFEFIKFYGLEAKLRKTIHEANATLEQLKSLSAVLAEPTISLIATNGIFPAMPLGFRLELVERINQILNSLSINQSDIQRMNQVLHMVLRRLYQDRILEGINNPPRNLITVAQNGQFPSPDEYEQFLVTRDLLTPERQELLSDFRHFTSSGEIRRPDLLQP